MPFSGTAIDLLNIAGKAERINSGNTLLYFKDEGR
jgi:hypothetical protein